MSEPVTSSGTAPPSSADEPKKSSARSGGGPAKRTRSASSSGAASASPGRSRGPDGDSRSAGERVKGATADAARSAAGAAETVGRAAMDASSRGAGLGVGAARGSARVAGRALGFGEPAPEGAAGTPVAGLIVKIPFASASVRLPGPGAVATVGPVRVTLPTGALYYGGLAALAAGGALELPVAAGAALAGAVLGRRWLRGPTPEISVYDTEPGAGPHTSRPPAAPDA